MGRPTRRLLVALASVGTVLWVAQGTAEPGKARAQRDPERFALHAPDPERYRLANGLEVVLDPLPGRREVTVHVTYHVGIADEPRGWTSLAHLVEHLMFEGSRHVPADAYIPWLERAGSVDRNATTSLDRTEYYQTVPSEQLETVLFLESDRMAYLLSTLTERNVEEQRRVVERERVERRVLSGRGALPAVLAEALYPEGHPYRDADERPEDLAAIRLAHVQWFVQSYYQPANATLVVSGGFDPALARGRIERWFGAIRRSGPRPARRPTPRIRLEDETRIVVEAPLTNDELAVASDHATMRVECTVRAERLPETLRAFDAEVLRLRDPARIDPVELETAINVERAELRTTLETRAGAARESATAFLRGEQLEDLARLDAALASVTATEVARQARAFRLGEAPVVLIGPARLGDALSRLRPGRFAVVPTR